ncbi:olfactory receptor 5V1-like [Pleurodeles waltl]|uniref:olfactory receptor 5V1-like n=1 Tax=Pleurodeles waltl TaxID=8319 RepID=UPI003709552B
MKNLNYTIFGSFILIGLSSDPENQIPLFVVFLCLYILNLMGNTLMVITITFSTRLRSPMYYFLRNLSFIDICFTTTTVPKMLIDSFSSVKTISFIGCVAQMYSFISLGGVECLLLAVMSLDRYVAVCKPLHYAVIMNEQVLFLLVATCWAAGLLNSLGHTVCTFQLPFCQSNLINHFFCDILPLLGLSCSDTYVNEVLIYTSGGSVIIASFMLTLLSYVFIILAILKIQTSEGRHKASSTCLSHLTVVCLFFGTAIFSYIRPISTKLQNQDKLIPVLFGIVTPTLNPVIYSLRNKDVQAVMKKVMHKIYELRSCTF